MMEWWGPVIWETYGGMEGAATIAKPYRWLEKPGTVGRSVAGMKVKILDEDGNELPPRGDRATCTSSPSGARTFAYMDDPELTGLGQRGHGLHPRATLASSTRTGISSSATGPRT